MINYCVYYYTKSVHNIYSSLEKKSRRINIKKQQHAVDGAIGSTISVVEYRKKAETITAGNHSGTEEQKTTNMGIIFLKSKLVSKL